MGDNLICRICLVRSKSLKSMFEHQNSLNVIELIAEITQVIIFKNDGLPTKICDDCLEKLCIVNDIRILCIESDRTLREQMNEDFQIKEKSVMVIAETGHDISEETLEEFNTVLDEEQLELESYSPTNFEYLDEVSLVEETPLVEEFLEETYLSDTSIHADYSYFSIEILDEPKSRKQNFKSNKLHQCTYCGKVFNSLSNLKGHELTHNQIKTHECVVCKKMFLMKCDLTKHLQIHKNERAYICKVCFKGFNKLNTMKDHERLVHSGDKTHVCSICDVGFPLKQQLISHGRTHTGEKPYQCNLCDKKYSHKIDLKRHIMLHTGNKPYKCPHCEKTFTKKSNMDCHIPVHTGEKPYKCDICFKEFRQPCPYKKHMIFHHYTDGVKN